MKSVIFCAFSSSSTCILCLSLFCSSAEEELVVPCPATWFVFSNVATFCSSFDIDLIYSSSIFLTFFLYTSAAASFSNKCSLISLYSSSMLCICSFASVSFCLSSVTSLLSVLLLQEEEEEEECLFTDCFLFPGAGEATAAAAAACASNKSCCSRCTRFASFLAAFLACLSSSAAWSRLATSKLIICSRASTSLCSFSLASCSILCLSIFSRSSSSLAIRSCSLRAASSSARFAARPDRMSSSSFLLRSSSALSASIRAFSAAIAANLSCSFLSSSSLFFLSISLTTKARTSWHSEYSLRPITSSPPSFAACSALSYTHTSCASLCTALASPSLSSSFLASAV
mmetsp:Transcript_35566/g.69778  ORF Transcript_35566/g.69778 Transcript_35566/m.69778 type:complete len:343 (+) Transcript_35566:282-1310(+)